MIKKGILAFVILGIAQSLIGGLILWGIPINKINSSNNLAILQIVFGGIVFWIGSYVYINSKLINVYAFLLAILINMSLLGVESLVSWINILLTILYSLNTCLILVLIIKYRKI